ncbi:hypothetical protein [Rhodococcus wratislaviensis]|uniref:hypothetical protein n=1 Tax=Rhodococcus wratislaviensis TaxID=44752 RepID=UPI0020D1CE3E|nr:hypothetical protein [Rhodococcus wratislaviensis]
MRQEPRDGRLIAVPPAGLDLTRSLHAIRRSGTRIRGSLGDFLTLAAHHPQARNRRRRRRGHRTAQVAIFAAALFAMGTDVHIEEICFNSGERSSSRSSPPSALPRYPWSESLSLCVAGRLAAPTRSVTPLPSPLPL